MCFAVHCAQVMWDELSTHLILVATASVIIGVLLIFHAGISFGRKEGNLWKWSSHLLLSREPVDDYFKMTENCISLKNIFFKKNIYFWTTTRVFFFFFFESRGCHYYFRPEVKIAGIWIFEWVDFSNDVQVIVNLRILLTLVSLVYI